MKTIDPNVLFNHQADFLLEKKRQIMKHKILLVLILISFYSNVIAQVTRTTGNRTIVVTEMNSLLASNGNNLTSRSINTAGIDIQYLRRLLTEVQPSSYLYSGLVHTYGDIPKNLFTDFASRNQIDNLITLKEGIEIAVIRINTANELNSTIDLATFSNFPNLKYIYFISSVPTTGQDIANIIINYNTRFTIFYKIDKGDNNQ